MTAHPTDDLAAFALGALDAAEAATVAGHVDRCSACRAEVRALRETAWTMAEATARDTTPGQRAAIVERARRESGLARRLGGLGPVGTFLSRPLPTAIPLALAVVVIVAGAGYVVAQRDADRRGSALSGIAGARVVALAPTGEVAGARGSLVVPQNADAPYLLLDLPAAPTGKIWEAWVIRGQTAIPAGTTDAQGVTLLTLLVTPGAGDTVAITAEPRGGADQPTGRIVLTGRA